MSETSHDCHLELQIQHLKDELELKTKVLLMPVDACVKRVMTGSTVAMSPAACRIMSPCMYMDTPDCASAGLRVSVPVRSIRITDGWHTAQVLQGAVDVALQALRQIEAFEQQVQEQEMATVRGERMRSTSGGGVMSAAQASAKLRRLIDQVSA